MIDLLKLVLGEDNPDIIRKEFFSLTTEFERNIEKGMHENNVGLATKLRGLLKNNVKLKRSDKVRLLKIINRAKVRALMTGTDDGDRIFRNLDSIGGDILRLM